MAINIFQMYMQNGCRFGFAVRRNSWGRVKHAIVTAIDGVIEGQPIEGEPPYFNRKYPAGHAKEGKIWKRYVTLEADWFDDGKYLTDCGGNYSWEMIL